MPSLSPLRVSDALQSPAPETKKQFAAIVDREMIKYRRVLCRIHAEAVESAPLVLPCLLDERFSAGYQLGLIEAGRLLRKMGEK